MSSVIDVIQRMYQVLLDMGFSTSEEHVYRYCVQHPNTSPTDIARGTTLPRSTVYMCMDTLSMRGFLTIGTKGKRRTISATSPHKAFASHLRDEKQRIRRQEQQIASLVQELANLPKEVRHRTDLVHYEGRAGVLHLIDRIAQEKADIHWIGSLEPILQSVNEETLFSRLTRKRYNQGTVSYAITTPALLKNKRFGAPLRGFREYRLVDAQTSFPGLLVLCGTTVSLVSMPGGVANVVLIQDKSLARMMHCVYQLLWDNVPELTTVT